MKRKKLLDYLERHGCHFLREGASHSLYRNVRNNLKTSLPRHREIGDLLAEKICKDLDIPRIRSKK
ncbi:MAG TPA: addiction module toxin, HicA family [Candidatus Paceibacterota bacterium]